MKQKIISLKLENPPLPCIIGNRSARRDGRVVEGAALEML